MAADTSVTRLDVFPLARPQSRQRDERVGPSDYSERLSRRVSRNESTATPQATAAATTRSGEKPAKSARGESAAQAAPANSGSPTDDADVESTSSVEPAAALDATTVADGIEKVVDVEAQTLGTEVLDEGSLTAAKEAKADNGLPPWVLFDLNQTPPAEVGAASASTIPGPLVAIFTGGTAEGGAESRDDAKDASAMAASAPAGLVATLFPQQNSTSQAGSTNPTPAAVTVMPATASDPIVSIEPRADGIATGSSAMSLDLGVDDSAGQAGSESGTAGSTNGAAAVAIAPPASAIAPVGTTGSALDGSATLASSGSTTAGAAPADAQGTALRSGAEIPSEGRARDAKSRGEKSATARDSSSPIQVTTADTPVELAVDVDSATELVLDGGTAIDAPNAEQATAESAGPQEVGVSQRTTEPRGAERGERPALVTHNGEGVEGDLVRHAASALRAADGLDRPIKIRLTPPELGALRVEVSRIEGRVSARFEVSSSAAQSLLQDHLSSLRESLGRAGVTVDRIEIRLAEPAREDGRSDGRGENGGQPRQESGGEQRRDQRQEEAPRVDPAETEGGAGPHVKDTRPAASKAIAPAVVRSAVAADALDIQV